MIASREGSGDTAAAVEPPPSSEWGPFHGSRDFGVNMAITLVLLFCTLAFALAASAIVRHLLRRRLRSVWQPSVTPASADPERPAAYKGIEAPPETLPALVFSTGIGLPGGAECAICLVEFAGGEAVRLLPSCGHGFHAGCVDPWIASRRSCPICRKVCLLPPAADGELV
ncbi:RING-H2 finger protein ATL79 [Apostasia shenzhenica]|uniref:RING-H2 finger protein ATL79 n=1 Tax=Apostasia shenzhenica TaxID=1088818 RepID=A0A2I0BEW3_9ASPA|nr:RING-H2 finger protein ATL79 [Apostasia shenzhenica]